jgi:hypothetical protein
MWLIIIGIIYALGIVFLIHQFLTAPEIDYPDEGKTDDKIMEKKL